MRPTRRAAAALSSSQEPYPVDAEATRLSQSSIWAAQRAAYIAGGPELWEAQLPEWISTNLYVANAYVEVVIAWLTDWYRPNGGKGLQSSLPIYILELGAGTGALSFHILTMLDDLWGSSEIADFRYVYVASDMVTANIERMEAHPQLRRYADAGKLDFAIFDVENPGEIMLRGSGIRIGAGYDANPLAVLANYVFDSTAADAFVVHDSSLYESWVRIGRSRPAASSGFFEDLDLIFEQQVDEISTDSWSTGVGSAHLVPVLEGYRRDLDGGCFLLPVSAITCLERLLNISGQRMLVLSSDKGNVSTATMSTAQTLDAEALGLGLHGSVISLAVNFDAIGRWAEGLLGRYLRPRQPTTNFTTIAIEFGLPAGGAGRLRRGFERYLDQFGLNDFALVRLEFGALATKSVDAALALLRLSHFDADVLVEMLPILLPQLAAMPAALKDWVGHALETVSLRHFDMGTGYDLDLVVAAGLVELDLAEQALMHLKRSAAQRPLSASVLYYMAACEHMLGDPSQALELLDAALQLDATHQASMALRAQLVSTLSGISGISGRG